MKATIYKVIIFDAEENRSSVYPIIFCDKNEAILEARKIMDNPEIPCDSVCVYLEEADPEAGFFRTKSLIVRMGV